jgi:hypothetical protein
MNTIDISTSYNFITTSSNNNRKNEKKLAFHYNNFYEKFHELMSELNKIKNSKNSVNKIKIGLIEKKQIIDSLLKVDVQNQSKIYRKQNANNITPANLVRNNTKNQKLLEELNKLSRNNKNSLISDLELKQKITELNNSEKNKLRLLRKLVTNIELANLEASLYPPRPNLHNT